MAIYPDNTVFTVLVKKPYAQLTDQEKIEQGMLLFEKTASDAARTEMAVREQSTYFDVEGTYRMMANNFYGRKENALVITKVNIPTASESDLDLAVAALNSGDQEQPSDQEIEKVEKKRDTAEGWLLYGGFGAGAYVAGYTYITIDAVVKHQPLTKNETAGEVGGGLGAIIAVYALQKMIKKFAQAKAMLIDTQFNALKQESILQDMIKNRRTELQQQQNTDNSQHMNPS